MRYFGHFITNLEQKVRDLVLNLIHILLNSQTSEKLISEELLLLDKKVQLRRVGMRLSKVAAVSALLLVSIALAADADTIWFSPTAYVTGDPSLQISYPYVAHPATEVKCSSPGDLKWIYMDLPLPLGAKIEAVNLCYQVSNPRSFISQIRLTEMSTPNTAYVRHDDPTDLTSTRPACYVSKVASFVPKSAVMLQLRLNFQDSADKITLGGLSITFTGP
jgi:hypothetical protein